MTQYWKNTLNSTEEDHTSYSEYKASIIIWKVIPPVLILFGTIGNILSVVVLTRKAIRNSTTALFLTFLTFSDLVVMYTGLLRQWIIYMFQFDVRHISEVMCKIHIWLVYTSLDFSAWILVAVTMERVIAVWRPYSTRRKCSRRTASIMLLIILLSLLGLNSHLLYGMINNTTHEGDEIKCSSIDENYSHFFRSAWSWIDLCVFSLIPLMIIIAGNCLISFKVLQRQRKANPNNAQPVQTNAHTNRHHTHHHHQSSMTFILITLNTVFVFTTLPVSIYNIGYTSWHTTNNQRTVAHLELWWAIVNMLMYTNNSINFLLYSLSGSRFRQELRRILCQTNNRSDTKLKASGIAGHVSSTMQGRDAVNVNQITNFLQVPTLTKVSTSKENGLGSCYTLCSDTGQGDLDTALSTNRTGVHISITDTNHSQPTIGDKEETKAENVPKQPCDDDQYMCCERNITFDETEHEVCEGLHNRIDNTMSQNLNNEETNTLLKFSVLKRSIKSKSNITDHDLEASIPLTIESVGHSLASEDETAI